MVGLGVVLRQHSFTLHGFVVRVEQVADVFAVLSILFELIDKVEDRPLLDELRNSVDVQEDAISY